MLTGEVWDDTPVSQGPIPVSQGPIPVSQGVARRTSGPVIDVPVVTGLVDEAVIAVQLLLAHVRQVFLGKEAGKGWIGMSRR